MNCKQVDKVYVRIISVSLLLSLCGVGVVSPRLCRAIFISEAEQTLVKQANAASPSSSDKGKIQLGCRRAKFPLRRILSSLSGRLSEVCAAGHAVRSRNVRCPATFSTRSKADSTPNHPLVDLTGCYEAPARLPVFVCQSIWDCSPLLPQGNASIMPIRAGPSRQCLMATKERRSSLIFMRYLS